MQLENSLTKTVQTQGRVLFYFLVLSVLQDLQLKTRKKSTAHMFVTH